MSYKVFDDLKPKLNERILNGKIKSEAQLKSFYGKKPNEQVSIEDITKPREAKYSLNEKCRGDYKPKIKINRSVPIIKPRVKVQIEEHPDPVMNKKAERIATKVIRNLSKEQRS